MCASCDAPESSDIVLLECAYKRTSQHGRWVGKFVLLCVVVLVHAPRDGLE